MSWRSGSAGCGHVDASATARSLVPNDLHVASEVDSTRGEGATFGDTPDCVTLMVSGPVVERLARGRRFLHHAESAGWHGRLTVDNQGSVVVRVERGRFTAYYTPGDCRDECNDELRVFMAN